ncbi:hypothetical protein GBA65_02085 [Rubrobacter marinus]|uniref:ChsH2 rubredoxin-like zinc ribbon domain-containing protein n=1 Tax=Rubrobacter marinus TaxID=2653852 RepID=A0A6G8Q2D4_9ACTN|nr:hypothetical protein GBA65_02085 [Rubrobacter marinus]
MWACGHVSFPNRPVCPNCLGTGVNEVAIGPGPRS